MQTINHKPKMIEAELHGTTVEYTTTTGFMLIPAARIYGWIEKNQLNVENVPVSNNSPYGDGNPEFDEYQNMEIISASEYLDEHFDEVSRVYFNEIIAA